MTEPLPDPTDPVALTAALVRCPSVTPEEGGAIRLLQRLLEGLGFACRRADRGGIANLIATRGQGGPVLGFNGHTDVVPVGDGWSVEPFAGTVRDGRLWGRGAADMKSGVAAFVSACARRPADAPGTLMVLITGDEEGEGVDGTAAILDAMDAAGERMDGCLVGEPTCPETMGEMIKIGRRGSLTAWFEAVGRMGHAAYPHRAANPLPPLVGLLDGLARWELDEGTAHFDPSTLAIVGVDTGNAATNVIPERARAAINLRFNDAHTGASLTEALERRAAEASRGGVEIGVRVKVSGEPFVTEPGPLVEAVAGAVEARTGRRPALSTSGGTSDARFIRRHCPVVEVGLVGATMHQADENVRVEDIETLALIYADVIERALNA